MGNKIEELKTVLYNASEGIRLISVLLSPVIINKAETALSAFSEEVMKYIDNVNENEAVYSWGKLKPGTSVKKIDSVFPRIDQDVKKTGKPERKMKGKEKAKVMPGKGKTPSEKKAEYSSIQEAAEAAKRDRGG